MVLMLEFTTHLCTLCFHEMDYICMYVCTGSMPLDEMFACLSKPQ